VVILVPDLTLSKREELLLVARGRPELFVTSGHYLALIAVDEVDQWVLFDHPYGVLEHEENNPYLRLLDLEAGVERVVMREHLEMAMAHRFVLRAF